MKNVKLLEMSDEELRVLLRTVEPGKKVTSMARNDLLEEAITWLLENGLGVGHRFTIIESEQVMAIAPVELGKCSCCPGTILDRIPLPSQEEIDSLAIRARLHKSADCLTEMNKPSHMTNQSKSTDNLAAVSALASRRSPSPARRRQAETMEMGVIKVQPRPRLNNNNDKIFVESKVEVDGKKTEKKRKRGGLRECGEECGRCCVNLVTACKF